MNLSSSSYYDVVVVGGGVVGLAVARAATLAGYKCALLEREAQLLHWASGSNSGIVCTGVDATPGTLERALIRDSISQIPYYLKAMGIPHRRCGSLVCQWPWDKSASADVGLDGVLEESHDAGDTHAKYLDANQILAQEPHLNNDVQGAVYIPGEIIVDPWLFSISFAVQARANGCVIHTNTEVDPRALTWDGEAWTVRVMRESATESPDKLRAKCMVCATGLWAPEWEETLLENLRPSSASNEGGKLKAAPRRGQYRIYQTNSSIALQHSIQPVPTHFTKGIFVFPSLYQQIVVGPTALDQASKSDRTLDEVVAKELDRHAQRILPGLNPDRHVIGEYVGIRPGTQHRDYQIRSHFSNKSLMAGPWITVAGIRSTGLTASLGIGRHVTHLLEQILRDCGGDSSKEQQNTASLEDSMQSRVVVPTLPPLATMIEEFRQRGDGTVAIHGHTYRVTHPLTILGWTHASI